MNKDERPSVSRTFTGGASLAPAIRDQVISDPI